MQDFIQAKLQKDFMGKKLLIVGLGLQGGGVGLTRFFSRLGAKVTVTDLKNKKELSYSLKQLESYPVTFRLGGHFAGDFLSADIIFKAPSVSWSLPELQKAQSRGVPVEMEVSFFSSICPATLIGITGTRGKSTTAELIFEILKKSQKTVYLGGNVPNLSTIGLLNKVKPKDYVVLELSSWQLSGFHKKKLSPHVAVFTSFYPDHLNYYKTMDGYLHDKRAIYLYQKPRDFLVAHESLKEIIEKDDIKSHVHYYTSYQDELFYLKGDHNKENAVAAQKVGEILDLDLKIVNSAIQEFKGIHYRLEKIRTIGNVTFINDTTATTPTATIKAIETFPNVPKIVILGGSSKKLPYDLLIKALEKVSRIVLLKGSFTDEIKETLKKTYLDRLSPIYDDFATAIRDAYSYARKQQTESIILLSPGAASFGLFQNEFQRGDEFNRIVQTL